MRAGADLPVRLADIEAAKARLAGHIVRTPFNRSVTLSAITGAEIWCKLENLQYTASFKERGALNRLALLDEAERQRGVVTMSAGNHAQGVALHCRRLDIPATIVMPKPTPFTKIENTKRLGADVLLEGADVDEAAAFAHRLAHERGLVFIPPFDDAAVIAGQGTIALEMLEENAALDAVLVPLGGGGLLAGMALAFKALRPDIRIIGVEADLYPSVRRLLDREPAGAGGPTIAEGIAVKTPGTLTMAIIRELVDDVITVAEADIEAAVLQFLEIEKTVVEGAGAAGLGAVLADRKRFEGRRVGLVISGGNIDSRLLSSVILRGLARSKRLTRLRIVVPDAPGSLAHICNVIAEAGANIVEVQHQRAFAQRSVKEAEVEMTIENRNERHADEVIQALVKAGFELRSLG